MATATEKHEGPLAVPVWREDEERVSKSERYLAKRLKAAAADHRSVAWSTFLVGSGIGLLGWLFVGVIAEHWLVPGGLPAWARAGWLVAAIAGLMAAAGKWLLPLLRYRINLVYAARTIEQGHPDLHNDLVNTVLLQGHSEGIPETVTHSLRRRTARGLARQPGDLVADRSQLLMMVYVLAALVVFACLYQIVSPKNLFVSAARLAAPWSRIMPPTRVQIAPPEFAWRVPPREGRGDDVMRRPLTVQRGEVTLHRGRQLIVSATIRGRRRGEQPQVTIVPLGENGRPDIASSWTVDMVRRGAGVDGDEVADGDEPTARREVYEVVLPGGDRGMDRSVTCSVSAGDGKTEPVRVVLIDVPSLLVREVRYEFPEYTKRPPETVEWQGDLRALEGTRATLVAEASLPLAKAWIDFGCDGKHDWEFSVPQHDLATARASFPLRLNETRSGPWFDSYQLQMQLASAEAGDVLTEEVRHRIEVIADLSPEVRIVKPAEQLVRVPPAAPAAVQVAARDPDFAISRVGLEYRVVAGDQQIADGFVWQPDMEHQGPLAATLVFTPADLGAGAGHRIAYRAVVEDNREPKPNRGVSHSDGEPWPEFEIDVKAEPQQQPPPPADTPDPEASQDQQPNEPGSEEPADTEGRQPQQGEDQPGQQDGPQQGENSGEQNAGNQESAAEQPEAGAEGQQAEDGQQGDAGEGQQGTSGEGSQSSPGEGGEDGQAGGTSEGQPNEGQQGESQQGEGTAPGDGTGQADGGQSTEDEGAGNSRQRPGAEGDNTQGAGRQGGDRGQEEHNGDGRGDGNNAESQPNEPIASDGTEDGEAMERILEHRRQGEGQQGEGQQGEGQQGEGQQGEGQQGEGQQG
ncbi:MAG: hypothetical protein ISQ07_04710, partial [Pirellulales bacterium]|nr:hypothetical protein [Pirellulales bacterium]